jgi:hypothetical protein
MLRILAFSSFYIVHLFTTRLVTDAAKALWAVVLLLGNVFAMPAY